MKSERMQREMTFFVRMAFGLGLGIGGVVGAAVTLWIVG